MYVFISFHIAFTFYSFFIMKKLLLKLNYLNTLITKCLKCMLLGLLDGQIGRIWACSLKATLGNFLILLLVHKDYILGDLPTTVSMNISFGSSYLVLPENEFHNQIILHFPTQCYCTSYALVISVQGKLWHKSPELRTFEYHTCNASIKPTIQSYWISLQPHLA